jgi:dihydroflavonol-4-reductase
MTSVLITGGTGFIGSRLALGCLDAGDTVRVLGQRRTPAEAENARLLQAAGIEVIEGSITDASVAARACGGMDVIHHLAAAQHEANVPDRHFHDVNVGGTRTLLDAAVAAGVPRFVHGSTIGVFGSGGTGPVTEAAPLEPDNIYGATKLEAESVVEGYPPRISVVIVRISETYGPGDQRLLKLFRALEKGRFVRIGPGQNLHHPIYIDDLVRGLRRAAEVDPPPREAFVLAGPEAITSDEMISVIARVVGRRPPRTRVPLWPLLTVARIMEATLGRIGIQPPLHRRRMNFFVRSFRFDMEPAHRTLGILPAVSFTEGAVRAAEWYRSQGLLGSPPQAASS